MNVMFAAIAVGKPISIKIGNRPETAIANVPRKKSPAHVADPVIGTPVKTNLAGVVLIEGRYLIGMAQYVHRAPLSLGKEKAPTGSPAGADGRCFDALRTCKRRQMNTGLAWWANKLRPGTPFQGSCV